jgi:hypothetical protein
VNDVKWNFESKKRAYLEDKINEPVTQSNDGNIRHKEECLHLRGASNRELNEE